MNKAKSIFKAASAYALALVFALFAMHAPALAAIGTHDAAPAWTVPAGYNEHDYNACAAFLEQADENGVKNGSKLSSAYDPNAPETWGLDAFGDTAFEWGVYGGEKRLRVVSVYAKSLVGSADFSACTRLTNANFSSNYIASLNVSSCPQLNVLDCHGNSLCELNVTHCPNIEVLYCQSNELTALELTGCSGVNLLNCSNNRLDLLDVSSAVALEELRCYTNALTSLDLSSNAALLRLYAYRNELSELDTSGCSVLRYIDVHENRFTDIELSDCTALTQLYVQSNELTALELSANTMLEKLDCSGNLLEELDLSANASLKYYLDCRENALTDIDLSMNPLLPAERILADGSGTVGYLYDSGHDYGHCTVTATPADGAEFLGWFDEAGALLCEDEVLDISDSELAVFTARFSSSAVVPGDIDGNGAVTVSDAVAALRLAMGLIDGSGFNAPNADMDGNGSVTIADAVLILRMAIGC